MYYVVLLLCTYMRIFWFKIKTFIAVNIPKKKKN
jgi:hypothetical protein